MFFLEGGGSSYTLLCYVSIDVRATNKNQNTEKTRNKETKQQGNKEKKEKQRNKEIKQDNKEDSKEDNQNKECEEER